MRLLIRTDAIGPVRTAEWTHKIRTPKNRVNCVSAWKLVEIVYIFTTLIIVHPKYILSMLPRPGTKLQQVDYRGAM